MDAATVAAVLRSSSNGAAALRTSKRQGRYVVAARPIASGGVVLESTPILTCAASQLWDAVCHGCMRRFEGSRSLADMAAAVFAHGDADGDGVMSFAEAAVAQAETGAGELDSDVWEYICSRVGADPDIGLTLGQHLLLAELQLSNPLRDYDAAVKAEAERPRGYPATLGYRRRAVASPLSDRRTVPYPESLYAPWRQSTQLSDYDAAVKAEAERPRGYPATLGYRRRTVASPLRDRPTVPYPESLYAPSTRGGAQFRCRECGVGCCSAKCAASAHPSGLECDALAAVRRAAGKAGLPPVCETVACLAAKAAVRSLTDAGFKATLFSLCAHTLDKVHDEPTRVLLATAAKFASDAVPRECYVAVLRAVLAQHFNAFGAWDTMPRSAVPPSVGQAAGTVAVSDAGFVSNGRVLAAVVGDDWVRVQSLEVDEEACTATAVLSKGRTFTVKLRSTATVSELRGMCTTCGVDFRPRGGLSLQWDLPAFSGGSLGTTRGAVRRAVQTGMALHFTAALLNHQEGRRPSVQAKLTFGDGGRLLLRAARKLAVGEELTVWYGNDHDEVRKRYAFDS